MLVMITRLQHKMVNQLTTSTIHSFNLNAGIIYKFANSNGTHNFTIVTPRDQAEIDALNAQINELRNRKPEVITKEVEVVKEVPAVKEFTVSDLVFVTFAQGKYNLTREAKAALDNIKEGSHVQVVGTASPEGSAAFNQKLSENRATVVANYHWSWRNCRRSYW